MAQGDLTQRVDAKGGDELTDLASSLNDMVGNLADPLTFLVDGAPIPAEPVRREAAWQPPGPGFYRLTVLDAEGAIRMLNQIALRNPLPRSAPGSRNKNDLRR